MLFLTLPLLAACSEVSSDRSTVTDQGVDGGRLNDGIAALWVDPDGCQHWYIDDGFEGYMTPRLNRDGTPRCDGSAAKGYIVIEGEPVAQ
ncbi:hypothetical protein [Pseudaestuariivita rosea]|uniref:hypothetical protein n=1 Tax=Pseudaestuariivita rosea TaxID=2763263 RepID=UPI001F2B66EB|nr:hypothetical protein [Pseudaestuariivita rosea]